MITVSWGNGHLAVVDQSGNVLDASSPAARTIIDLRMAQPVIVFRPGRPEMYEETLTAGDPGFVVAVLRSLDGATLTGDITTV